MPYGLLRHFYRGFVDGDGSLYPVFGCGSWRFDALGSPKFIRQFQQWLVVNAGVSYTKLLTPDNSPASLVVRYTGGPQILRIASLLYTDATVYLARKYAQFCKLRSSRGGFKT